MALPAYSCGIIVPVRDEERSLPHSVPALLAAVQGENARIIWVCNGCRDDSVRMIRKLAGRDAEVRELSVAGKTAALQTGDRLLDAEGLFPRIYLDADTTMRPGDISRLLQPLREGRAELVAATHAMDLAGVSSVSAAIARCWLALPFARNIAMLGAVAVSHNGRARWREWPRITADDMFMAATVPAHCQMLVADAIATTRPPPTFGGWVSMRARWLRGERELRARGLNFPAAQGQRRALMRRLLSPRTCIGALAFCAARLLAVPLTCIHRDVSWTPERRTLQADKPEMFP